MSVRPATVADPVCGMTVDVATAEANGLTVELGGRMYAFCRDGCKRAFESDPMTYAAERSLAVVGSVASAAAGRATAAMPVIDEGMRRWYESCSCCLSEAFPEVQGAARRRARSGCATTGRSGNLRGRRGASLTALLAAECQGGPRRYDRNDARAGPVPLYTQQRSVADGRGDTPGVGPRPL